MYPIRTYLKVRHWEWYHLLSPEPLPQLEHSRSQYLASIRPHREHNKAAARPRHSSQFAT
jgi:hypothetical protein